MLRFHLQISQEVAESYAVFPVKEPTQVCMMELKRWVFCVCYDDLPQREMGFIH